MPIYEVFGVHRNIDIPVADFPSKDEIKDYEDRLLPAAKDNNESATGIQQEHGWFESSHQKEKLHYRKFTPKSDTNSKDKERKDVKAVIIWMHGINTHGGIGGRKDSENYYITLQIQRYVQQEHYAFYSWDNLGSGYSEGERFLWPSIDVLVQDYAKFVTLVASLHQPTTPIFLTGMSIGANFTMLAGNYFQQQQRRQREQSTTKRKEDTHVDDCCLNNIDSLILLAPANVFPKWKHFILTVIVFLLECGMILFSPVRKMCTFGYFRKWNILPDPKKENSIVSIDTATTDDDTTATRCRTKKNDQDHEANQNKNSKNIHPKDTSGSSRYHLDLIRLNKLDKMRNSDFNRPNQTNITVAKAVLTTSMYDCQEESLPPFCIIHGSNDKNTSIQGSKFFLETIQNRWNREESRFKDDPGDTFIKHCDDPDPKTNDTRRLHVINDAEHDLLGDRFAANEVMDTMIQWIHQRLSKRNANDKKNL